MFTTTVSAKILTDFFNCKLNGVLKVNNTRLLAYLMMQLSCYNYIVYEWQSVIANNKLILKKIKGEPLIVLTCRVRQTKQKTSIRKDMKS